MAQQTVTVPEPRGGFGSTGRRDILSRASLAAGVAGSLVTGPMFWLAMWLVGPPVPLWLCFASALPVGFGWAMAAGRGHRLTAGTPFHFGHGPRFVRMRQAARPVADSKPIGPRETWRHHLWFRMPLGLGVGLAMALLLAPVAAWDVGFGLAARIALVATLWTGLLSGPVSNVAVATALTALHLHVTEGTPVRLLPFLEDARRRNLLRVIGPVYQFRHARLQERLARQQE